MSFQRVASLDDLWSGEMIAVEVEGTCILLVNLDDHIYAYADACPHQKSRLSEGNLAGTTLRCARHHWEFDVCTGQGINPQSACLTDIRVTLQNREILIDVHNARLPETLAESENRR